MADLNELQEAVAALARDVSAGIDLLGQIRDLLKQQVSSQGQGGLVIGAGGSGGGAVGGDGAGGAAAAAQAAIAAGSGRTSVSGSGGRLGQLAEFSAGVARDVSNPFTSNREIALDAAEAGATTLGGLAGGAIGGAAGKRIGQSLGGVAFNAAGGAEQRLVEQTVKRDLQGILSGLAEQGIAVTDDQARELRDSLRTKAERVTGALKQGARVAGELGQSSGGGGGGDPKLDKTNAVLERIEQNTRRSGGSGRPDAGLTGE